MLSLDTGLRAIVGDAREASVDIANNNEIMIGLFESI